MLFTRIVDFAHPSIPSAIAAIEALGDKRVSGRRHDQPEHVQPRRALQCAAIVFVSTTGNVLPLPGQRATLEGYVRAGGAWVGRTPDLTWRCRSQRLAVVVGLVGAAFQGHTRTHVWAAAPVPGTV